MTKAQKTTTLFCVLLCVTLEVQVLAQSTEKTFLPDARGRAHLVYHPPTQAMLLIDGYAIHQEGSKNDVWKWDGKRWSKMEASGPGSRCGNAADLNRKTNEILTFGGWGKGGFRDDTKNDTWKFDGTSWTQVQTSAVEKHDHHQMVYADHLDAFVVYGGRNSATGLPDSTTWLLKNGTFTPLQLPGPGARGNMGFAYDPKRKKVVLFGGKSFDVPADLWEFDGKKWENVSVEDIGMTTGMAVTYSEGHRMVVIHGYTGTWSWDGKKMTKLASGGPSGSNVALGYDPSRQVLVAYGGYGGDNTVFSALWELEKGGQWKKISDNGSWKWQGDKYEKVAERETEPFSPKTLDPLSYGVVLDHPEMTKVEVTRDVNYLEGQNGSLAIDIYSPPGMEEGQIRPAIIFLNAIGENPSGRKVKSWGIYTSWPQLMAAHGYIGISMEADGSRIQESIEGLFAFLDKEGRNYHVDKNRLGVYAASANVSGSATYLMGGKAYPKIKAAVFYYGSVPEGPYRKDLPVLFVVSEGDVSRNGYGSVWSEVLKNNAPWTIKMATGMPHAFDAYSDNDEARIILRETISFWKNHLDPIPQPSFPYSVGREIYGSGQLNPARSLALLKTMAEEHPDDANVLSAYGDFLRQNNEAEEAEKVYLQLLKLEPTHLQALINVALVAYSRGENSRGEEYVRQIEASGKADRNTYVQLGYGLLVANKNKEAVTFYLKALALQPRHYDYYNLACAYAKEGEAGKAVEALDNSLTLGYGSREQIENDPDFNAIKSDPRFLNLLNSL